MSPTEINTLSLHDALPISIPLAPATSNWQDTATRAAGRARRRDRKSTRLNSSHVEISYAVFCLKKKNCEVAVGNQRAAVRGPQLCLDFMGVIHMVGPLWSV